MTDLSSPESRFWQAAEKAAATSSGHALYRSLQAQYRATRPDASYIEHEQAMTRIARLAGV